ncbi:MAG: HNH endonuclease [Actinomycetota bacterium]|nr:HNH endonuclease [Actinomycetota bacterium]
MSGSLLDTLGTVSREFDAVLAVVRESACVELLAAQRELERLSRKVLAAQVELDAAVADAGLCGEHGYATTRAMLAEVHRLAPREATARQARCEQLATRRSLTGEVLPPRLPATAAALAEGAIGTGHVEVIGQVMHGAADRFDPQTCASVEEQVVSFARKYSPRETGVLGAQLLNRLDADGPEPAEPDEAPRPDNTLFLGRSRRGGLKLTGEFDAAGEAAIRAMIDALAKPRPAIDGVPDERSLPARQGDALVDAAHQVLGFGELPDCGGERPHVAVTIDLDALRDSLRGALLDYGPRLHPETARMLACDAGVVPVVLAGPSQPLDVGRSRRTLGAALRRALVVRAGGCCEMPGCDRPASWCEGHHMIHWAHGGATALHNLLLLCRRHHVLVHRLGWDIHLDAHGHPVFTPPALLDPTRTPRPSRLRC